MMRSAKELLSSTVELYRAHFWLFIGYAAWTLVPTAAFLIVDMVFNIESSWYLLMLPIMIASIFIYFWVVSVLSKAAHLLSQQKLIDTQNISTSAMRVVAPLFMTAFLVGLITTGGFLLLIVPGILFTIWYSQAVTVAIIEEERPINSLTRSKQLVKGRGWDVFFYLLVATLVFTIPYLITLAIPTGIGVYLTGIDPLDLFYTSEILIWPEAIQAIVDMIFTPIFVIYQVLLYQELVKNPLEQEAKVA
jgi:hypothetical protein